MLTLQSNMLTIVDQTDNRKLEIYIKSNMPTTQIFNQNTKAYSPDWESGFELTADVYLDSREMESYDNVSFKWSVDDGSSVTDKSTSRTYKITDNVLKSNPILTYICVASYQNITATSKITFTRVDTGKNGADGTSVNIKGTATSVTSIPETDYYTITYEGSDISSAQLNDSYMYNGDLYTCVDSRDGVDYFINVGRIQGPAGQDAKSIILTGNSQVFRISKTNAYTPSTISVTATAINTSVTDWSYSVNGGQAFLSTAPTGVVRNGNVVTITGSTFTSNSLVIKASDGKYSDTLTIYKAFDALDGTPGNPGAPAPIAFLTNENVSFSADADGKVALTSFNTNVVAYEGTTKVTPTIRTKTDGTPDISDLPAGMTVSAITSGTEIILTFSIARDSTLGSPLSNHGTIMVPVISPVNTDLTLSWSKINTGATGVGISSTTVTYGVSDSANTQPTEWKTTVPAVEDGKYLWTRTVIDYTDSAKPDTVTYTYAKQGTVGETGSPGSSVTVSSVQYQAGTSATTEPTGTWSNSVVSVPDGNYLWTKTTFSDNKVAYGVAKQGSSGTPASLVNITPSALYFKSTTGSTGTFTPQYIYLYPRFQSATYSNWQYSRDGGTTWTTASGANGLTIGTYNSVANSLRIDRSSTLYTSDVTSISFRCNSTVATVYDTVSIAKIYDVADIQIGGVNLLRGTKDFSLDTTRMNGWNNASNYTITTDEDGFAIANRVHTGLTSNVNYGIFSSLIKATSGDKLTASFWMKIADVSLWDTKMPLILELYDNSKSRVAWRDCYMTNLNLNPATLENNIWTYCTISFELNNSFFTFVTNKTWNDVVFFGVRLNLSRNGDISFKKVKLERGNKFTDWSPASEDLLDKAANVNVMLSNESHFFEATAGGVPTETSIVLDVIGYKGSIQSATTVGTISGLPSAGMTATIASNGTTSTKITVAVTSALTSNIADYGVLTIPITVNDHTINKRFNWVKAKAGDAGQPGYDAVTFQVYSNNGYALSINTPTITLQTFAYIGDVAIQADATYQWYRYSNTDWTAISGATKSYFTVSRDDVSFSNSYMCKMQFKNTEYVGVVTIDDKNDTNKVFTTKPSNYVVGDLWIVGVDYIPTGIEVGTLLRAEQTRTTYADADWVTATKYDEKINVLQNNLKTYDQYFAFDSSSGLKISARDTNGTESKFSTSLTNERLSFNYGNESVAYIDGTKMNIKEAVIESPLTVTGKYSGSTMLQAPVINIGNFSIIVESNGSLSIVANT